MSRFRGETVHRLPYASTIRNAHGAETVLRGIPVPVDHAGFDPGQSVETFDGGQRVASAPVLYLGFGQAADARDQWRCRGSLYEVDGEIDRWRNPYTGRGVGTVITLRRVSG